MVMETLFLLITNVVHSFKILNTIYRSKSYDKIIKRGNIWKLRSTNPKDLEIVQKYVYKNKYDLSRIKK